MLMVIIKIFLIWTTALDLWGSAPHMGPPLTACMHTQTQIFEASSGARKEPKED